MKIWITLLLVTLINTISAEQIDLTSYSTGFDSIPIAVVEFRSLNNSTISRNKPWNVIGSDLTFSGKFGVTRMTKVDSSLFTENNISLFIDGEYTVNGNKVVLDCYVYDVATMELLIGKKYRGELKSIRKMAHRFSDQIIELILTEKGPFTSKILYVQDRGNNKSLHIMDYDGFNIKKLPVHGKVNVFPAFLDSNTIVWTSFLRGKPDIYKGSIYSKANSIFLYSRYIETSPTVSSIVDKVAYSSSKMGSLDIYTCDIYGKNRKRLTFSRGIDTSPCWSPNGYHIAFTSDRSGQPQIYIMDAEGVNTRRITFEGSYQDSPSWSPRGDKIAYCSLQKGKFDIWVIDPDGSNAKKVTTKGGNNEYATWSPDGSHIAFVSRRGGRSDIYAIRPDGTGLKQITRSGNAKMPDWSNF